MIDIKKISALLVFATLPVIADQSATFLNKATQGFAWEAMAQVIYEKIAITVQADHLDVEHELEVAAKPNWSTPGFPISLEITGQLTLEQGAVVTGFLLWNGDKILKGKLRTKAVARQKYEEVVDRNVTIPPVPRDPALLEKVGANRYDLSIFPVVLNQSRKLRLRYLIPTGFQEGAHRCRFPHAFSSISSVTIRGGVGIQGYALTSTKSDGSQITVKNQDGFDQPLTLQGEAYNQFQPRSWVTGNETALVFVTPLFGEGGGSRVDLGTITDALGVQRHAAHFVFYPPSVLTDRSAETATRMVAIVRSETDSVTKEIGMEEGVAMGEEELRVFSASAFKEGITWRLFQGDKMIKEKTEIPRVTSMEDGPQFVRTFGNTPFYPMAKTMPASLAAAWGFIDSKYALLALEQDTLSKVVANEVAAAGVPSLKVSDIFPEDGALDSIPLSAWLMQRNISREDLLRSATAILPLSMPNGIHWHFRDGILQIEMDASMRTRDLRITLHGLDGRQLKQWQGTDISNGGVQWMPKTSGYGFGTCMLRITSGTHTWSARVTLR
jgi:hypothetical protein